MRSFYEILVALFCLLAVSGLAQNADVANDTTSHTWISLHREGAITTIQGHYLTRVAGATSLRYELISEKRGGSGHAISKQSGPFTAHTDSTVTLSQATLKMQYGDTYIISLHIFDGNTAIASDSISVIDDETTR